MGPLPQQGAMPSPVTAVSSAAPQAMPPQIVQQAAAQGIDPMMLAQILKQMSGGQPGTSNPGAATPVMGATGGAAEGLGKLAMVAQQSHQSARPELYNSAGAFNWERALGNGWAPEVIKA